jgi:hypothetical protein
MEPEKVFEISNYELEHLLMSLRESLTPNFRFNRNPDYPNPETGKHHAGISIAINVIENFRSELINDLLENDR